MGGRFPEPDPSNGGWTMRAVLSASAALLLAAAGAYGDEAAALERLSVITSELELMGEMMVGDPVSGTLTAGDTASLDIGLDRTYMYSVYVWSDSYFNVFRFWMEDPLGASDDSIVGDNATLTVFPDTSATWTLNVHLLEGAYGDTASYAAALFRSPRMTSCVSTR